VEPTTTQPKIVVIMPAYNASRTLEQTFREIPRETVAECIVVDDLSADSTVEVARKLGLRVFLHRENQGYGGNQKTCYVEALKTGADIVVMLHPDYQYDPQKIPDLVRPIIDDQADLVLGSRMAYAVAGGMPFYKRLANRFLTWCENKVFKLNLSEYHTGFRAFRRGLLEKTPFLLNSNDFIFDQEIVAQAVWFGARLKEISVPHRYFAEASTIGFGRSVRYGLGVLGLLAIFILNRSRVLTSRMFRPLHHDYSEVLAESGSDHQVS
jgi:glycosyltransferase involved in cell wall biosynthesis